MLVFESALPSDPDVVRLVEAHLAYARENTPPEDIYAFDGETLESTEELSMFVLREDGEAIAMGAITEIEAGHGELKSIHTLAARRGQGLGERIVSGLLNVARDRGYERVSLETGATPGFAASRRLYERFGFAFEYGGTPNQPVLIAPTGLDTELRYRLSEACWDVPEGRLIWMRGC